MKNGCPGAAALKGAQKLKIKICPECGGEIEIFSKDVCGECKCGFVAYNDSQNCIQWCAYAKECVGDEIYEKFTKKNEPENGEKEK
ncbi:MAG: hypothetical protein FWD23_00930 [Oscillospiraceae bacterium]|nr:hypothetical protein [Oscillospiraceae bacterium]